MRGRGSVEGGGGGEDPSVSCFVPRCPRCSGLGAVSRLTKKSCKHTTLCACPLVAVLHACRLADIGAAAAPAARRCHVGRSTKACKTGGSASSRARPFAGGEPTRPTSVAVPITSASPHSALPPLPPSHRNASPPSGSLRSGPNFFGGGSPEGIPAHGPCSEALPRVGPPDGGLGP